MSRTIQLWPRGESVTISESQYDHVADDLVKVDGQWVEPSAELKRKIDTELCAERLLEHEVLCCDSSLVDELLQHGGEDTDLGRAFAYEELENIYVDPSDWDVERCHRYLQDEGGEEPEEDNPWTMTPEAIRSRLGVEEDEGPFCQEQIDQFQIDFMESIDSGSDGDLDAWREAVREYSQEHLQEPLEWWRVSQYLCEELRAIGEVVLDNDYGYWWGRTCSGQAILMDGTLQQTAARVMLR